MSVQPCSETCVNHPLELDTCLFCSLASPATCLTTIHYLFIYYLFTSHPSTYLPSTCNRYPSTHHPHHLSPSTCSPTTCSPTTCSPPTLIHLFTPSTFPPSTCNLYPHLSLITFHPSPVYLPPQPFSPSSSPPSWRTFPRVFSTSFRTNVR